jgi:IPT/TIG domain
MRLTTFSVVLSVGLGVTSAILLGCGSSGSPTTPITPTQPTSNPVPAIASVTPSTIAYGSSDTTITVTGSNFISSSVVVLNAEHLTTSYVSSTSLTAVISAADLSHLATDAVYVLNPTPGGGISSAINLPVQYESPQGVSKVNIGVEDITWDPVNQVMYLSPVTNPAGLVQILDPSTGVLGTSALVNYGLGLVSVSANSKYLYVSAESSIERLNLPDLTPDISIPFANESSQANVPYAMQLQASPAADGTVAVVYGAEVGTPEEQGGVVLYDDAVPRQNTLCGFGQLGCTTGTNDLFDSIQWNAAGDEMYAANNETAGGDFYTANVSYDGFSNLIDYRGTASGGGQIHYDATTGYVYTDSGKVIDPANGSVVGSFNASGVMIPDGKLGIAYFLGQSASDAGTSIYSLESFNIHTFAPISSLLLDDLPGPPTHLIRWGNNGLAFATSVNGPLGATGAKVYLISNSFVTSTSATAGEAPRANISRTWSFEPSKPTRAN